MLGKHQVDWVIDFSPGQSISARIADRNSFVCEFLYGNIEELVHAAGRDHIFHFPKKSVLYGL